MSRHRALHTFLIGVENLEGARAGDVPQVGGAGASRRAGCSFGKGSTRWRRKQLRWARRS
eukprot:5244825-Prymnesium_polylepis.1